MSKTGSVTRSLSIGSKSSSSGRLRLTDKPDFSEIERAAETLIVAINAARLRLPRKGAASNQAVYAAERQLRTLCQNTQRLLHQQCMHIERRRSARLSRPSKEEKAEAALKQQVIDAGYRALATKLHPDAGGSNDAMTRLNQTRDKLKARGRR